ncbi:MAG TPA: hypothetical protein VLT47_03630, partial [Anaeromyxobacteraceae bacterium]|nr:hypothetical protein [Anaeromyxobacteraceae bacterium]
MSARRPAAAPGLIAALTAAVPARLVRKLDGAPGTAEGWTWDLREDGSGTVTTDGGERVALSPEAGRLSAPSQIACSCLLAPRCLHLLAVLIALPVDAAAVDPAAGGAAPSQAGGEGSAPQAGTASGEVTTAQREAASVARRALGEVLAAGAQGAGVVLQAEVLRAVHACRAANLPRLSALLLTVSSGIRACREESADFELEGFARSLGEALRVARALGRPAVDGEDLAALVGLARRAYAEAGSLRLYGLFSEPILTASGYGGVVTTFLGPGGELFSASDVVPGGPERIAGAYAGGARLGGGTLSHRELGRSGLHVEGATTSPEGRLGAGQGVRAVSAGPSRWAEAAAAVRFDEPLRAQLDRALGGDGSSPSGTGLLLFFRA